MNPFRRDPRPIMVKNAAEIAKMRTAGKMLREVFETLAELVVVGVLDTDLDRLARERIEAMGATPAFLGYRGYPASICCSINGEVVHGVPSGRRLEGGDIAGIDIGLAYDGYLADSAWTYAAGEAPGNARRLMETTREALRLGIDQMREGRRVGDVSAAIQTCAEAAGYGVVTDYSGHGIGRELHEGPELPNVGKAGTGKRLREGVVIAIEPMINEGSGETRVLGDGWTVVTADGGLSAHFEHTVAVTRNGPEVLTL